MKVVCVFLLTCVGTCVGQFRDVVIDQGPVRGYAENGVYSFYGIPYATAPTGQNRFKGPLLAPTWTDIFNATTKNIICPQRHIFSDTFLSLDRRVDCLRANVFVPNTNETSLPVMVYVHGGGFQEGYSMLFDPTGLVQRGIIAVNINYRLGVHGFLCLGTEFAPGNAGFKDMVAALRWVKNNIVHFGGDANSVTLAGSSIGSMAVESQIFSEMSNGLFNRAILESGAGLLSGYIQTDSVALVAAQTFASRFGVITQDIEALEEFFALLNDTQLSIDAGFMGCLETHDLTGVETFLKELPVTIIQSGNYEKRQLLSGFTPMEGLVLMENYDNVKQAMEENLSGFLPSDIQYDSERRRSEVERMVKDFYFPTEVTHQGYIDFFTDMMVVYPQMVSARFHTKNAALVYLYLYSFNGTVNLPSVQSSPVWGPGHVAQSLYVQDYDYTPVYADMTAGDLLTQERLRDMWVNFVKFGNPIPARTAVLDVDWSPVDNNTDYFLDIDLQMTLFQDPLAERIALWDEVYGSGASDITSNLRNLFWMFGDCFAYLIRSMKMLRYLMTSNHHIIY